MYQDTSGERILINLDLISNDFSHGGRDTYWENIAKGKWGSYITEVGCEGGRWSELLSDLGWHMICTDIDPNVLAICKKRIPTAKCVLVKKEDTTLPCESESVNLLICVEVINVLSSDWFIIEGFRVLQDGGGIVGVFKNKLSFRGYFRHLVSSLKGEVDYYKVSYPNWRHKFCRQGFKMLYQEGICWFPFTRNSNSPLISICTQLECYLGIRRLSSLSPWVVVSASKKEIMKRAVEGGLTTISIRPATAVTLNHTLPAKALATPLQDPPRLATGSFTHNRNV